MLNDKITLISSKNQISPLDCGDQFHGEIILSRSKQRLRRYETLQMIVDLTPITLLIGRCLVGSIEILRLVAWNIDFYFSIELVRIITPTDELIFLRGFGTTNQHESVIAFNYSAESWITNSSFQSYVGNNME